MDTRPRALFVIAQHNFRDEELLDTKSVVLKHCEVHIASTAKGLCVGKLGAVVQADLTLEEAITFVGGFSAVIFVGGPGVEKMFTNPAALELAKKARRLAAVKVLGAICWAPVLLAHAGVIAGEQVTGLDAGMGEQYRELKAAGASIGPGHVVVSGKVVTADGPKAAHEFGKKIVELLH